METTSAPAQSLKGASQFMTIGIIGVMFFIFGFVTWLNGPLITFVKLAFTLSDVEAFLVPMVFYMSYFFLALPSAFILKRTGMKKGMALGLLVMAIGAAIFGQLATMRIFEGALTGLFIIGAGLAVLQTAANPYISIVGPIESAAQRIAVMGICNKFAGILAPIVIGALVLQGVGELDAQVAAATTPEAKDALLNAFAAKIHYPYLAMAGLLALLALFVLKSPLPEIKGESKVANSGANGGKSLFSYPHLWLGVVCLFLYVGVEVMAGDAIGTYGHAFGLPIEQTAYFTSFTLIGMLVGYIVGLIVIPKFATQERYLAFSAILGVVFVIAAYLTRDYVSVGFVAALGFANAMMWPAIFPLAIRGLGRHTETGSAIMIMGICGGAIIPQAFVLLKETYDFQLVFLVLMVPAYLYILFFAIMGSKAGTRKVAG
ncbi:sugar MFS transporter [Asticcacaulis sp. ZE23SCel15]|uniref:sugar MFS transporter n=1 Tax=Asticcacaulis sp. ZE23SCel15 TaxID=3059027 RepID=UPI00265E761D|nr:sugar MFS transporter [Asticcacaulis sp. ZE23SCel15]WKL58454.1 sugar MFS transporter [Asticcacaulis sp. ZE23SCel15]